MSIERIRIAGLLASLVLAAAPVTGQDFNQRYAAWQGRGPMSQRMVSQSTMPTPPPEVGGESEAIPPPRTANSSSQRILGQVYDAPMHTPNYNNPWTSSPCAACSHGPMFEPHADHLGTCNYMGGGDGCGGCGHGACCGHGGCFGGGCSPCGACGGAGGGCDWGPLCCNTLVWTRVELLLWWRQGRDYPPLVTTDPTTESSVTAGILPDAEILLGDERVASNMQAGGRFDIGCWLNPTQTIGFGDRVWGLGRDSTEFLATSNNEPILAIPFRDLATGNNDALLVAYPGLRTGGISVVSTSTLVGNDVYARLLLCRDCNSRLDFITGWNFTRITDRLDIRSRSTVTEIGGTIPTGTVTEITDNFRTRNDFHGGILGLQWHRCCDVWTYQVMGRMSLGGMMEKLRIDGASSIAVPGQAVQNSNNGLFAGPGNNGRHERTEFTAITEVGVNIGYRFAPCTQLNLGYTFMYWNDVLTPGKSIDTTVGTINGTTRPQPLFQHADFWVQGLNLGLTKEF